MDSQRAHCLQHIYEKAGFKLTGTEEHQSWGQPVVSEFWDLQL
jgi:hypothetical protein